MKHTCFLDLQEGHDLPKVGENYNCDLSKVSKLTVIENSNFPKVREMT